VILLVIPAVALAVVSVASFFGGWLWWLDVLANFRAQFVVGLLVFSLSLLLTRFRRTGIAVFAVAVVNLIPVLPLYVGSPGESEPSAPSIRVMSFNLLSDNERFGEVIDYIRSIDPDLVLLHEASRPWEVAVEAAGLGYEVIRPRSDNLIFGTLVLVRGVEIEAVSFGFAAAQPRAVQLSYRPTGWPEAIDVLSTHPLAPTERVRADLRDAQLQFAADWASGLDTPRFVVGDFNATPWSSPFRGLMDDAGLRNSQIGFGLQPSFPTTSNVILRVPIDHLVHSDHFVVRDRRLGPDLGSDHFPLIVDIELAP
jgi:endonuclease/exonuclease/phosphatase (EEP) superfamily protein YafD